MKRFENKHAVVTGGASGIGRAIAERLAEEGAEVHIFDRDAVAAASVVTAIESAGGQARAHEVDVASSASVAMAVASIDRIDVMVNSAGVAAIGKLESTTTEDMDRVFSVNVKGVYHCMQEAMPKLRLSKSGVILNLASIASHVGIEDRFAYSMSKGAVFSMTLSVARDYLDAGVRCNCISPARVHTPFVDSYLDRNYPENRQEMLDQLAAFQPIGRMGTPAEIAGLAAYLCSDEASFVTGVAYSIDGGVMNLR
jgi:NAD(P)-dependent dehydrogenase (short-subunit alcohol dehydrogenase family)